MSTLFCIVIIALVLIGGLFIFPKKSSNGKKLGDEETDKAEEMAMEDDAWLDSPVIFEKRTIGYSLDKAWEAFNDIDTQDVIELDTASTGCQLSVNKEGSEPRIQVTYAFKVDLDQLIVPDYIRNQYDGDLLSFYYKWPEEKELMSSQIQEVLGGTLNSYVYYHKWDNKN